MWYQIKDNYVFLNLKIQANAKTTEFREVLGDFRKVALHAPPREGEANAELIRFIAKFFKLHQKEVEIVKGHTSKLKTIKLPLNTLIKEWLE